MAPGWKAGAARERGSGALTQIMKPGFAGDIQGT
jgi:hypothetical protein